VNDPFRLRLVNFSAFSFDSSIITIIPSSNYEGLCYGIFPGLNHHLEFPPWSISWHGVFYFLGFRGYTRSLHEVILALLYVAGLFWLSLELADRGWRWYQPPILLASKVSWQLHNNLSRRLWRLIYYYTLLVQKRALDSYTNYVFEHIKTWSKQTCA
jgi:hypothetical protein